MHCRLALLYVGAVASIFLVAGFSHKPLSQHSSDPLLKNYVHLLVNSLTGSLYPELGRCGGGPGMCALNHTLPYRKEMRERGNDWPPIGYTMVGHLRLYQIRDGIEEIVRNKIPGDFAEFGVWRGGSSIFARAILHALGEHARYVFMFDAWAAISGYESAQSFLCVDMTYVQAAFDLYGLSSSKNVFWKGPFNTSLPRFLTQFSERRIAFLRLDANFYDSYEEVMYAVYEMVPVGGIVVFDDILSHPAVQAFWKDFQRDQNFSEVLVPIDDHSAFFRKTKNVSVRAKGRSAS